jgi:hypothetical protein
MLSRLSAAACVRFKAHARGTSYSKALGLTRKALGVGLAAAGIGFFATVTSITAICESHADVEDVCQRYMADTITPREEITKNIGEMRYRMEILCMALQV